MRNKNIPAFNSTPLPLQLNGETEFDRSTPFKTRRARIALYSHDTMGLGHMRRNLLIANTLISSNLQANILMITGASVVNSFTMPKGVDCLTLPSLKKESNGNYRSRTLDLSVNEITSIRANTILGAMKAYEPDVVIVDNVPRGANQELDPTLDYLKNHTNARCILGLRDVMDDPLSLQREWHKKANEKSIQKFYDAVWVYGDPAVYDPIFEYSFPRSIADKITFTGYFDRNVRLPHEKSLALDNPLRDLGLPPGKLALCVAGGGEDGVSLTKMFAKAQLPPETNGVVLTGPFMPQSAVKDLQAMAAIKPRFRVLEFHPEPTQLLKYSDHVVSMGGYNSISEILSFNKRALVVPRVIPRKEQLIRAELFRDRGFFDVLHPDDATPEAISRWLSRERIAPPEVKDRINFNGLQRLPTLINETLTA